jgi:cytochrome c553
VKRHAPPALLVVLCATSLAAWPQETPQELPQRLAPCLACHRADVQPAPVNVPLLGGQPAPYLLIQLYLFRENLRVAPVMNQATKGLSDADLQRVADALAALPPAAHAPASATDQGAADAPRLARARDLVQANHCGVCHLADFSGHDNIPRIAGQREDYLARALRAYKSNTRPGYDASMAEVLAPIGGADIDDLAYFLARTR